VRHSSGRKRRKHEEHTNHEAWAIPYGDLMTLLLAFFVVMYAISSVNAGKYRVLSDSLFAAFRGAPRSMTPIQVGERQVGEGADMRPTVNQQAVLEGQALSSLAPVPVSMGKSAGSPATDGKLPPAAAAAAAALSRVADDVERAMDSLVKKDQVKIRRSDFWIEVEMRTDILFPSGSARLADNAVPIIEQLGTVLSAYQNPIRVEGHTDNKPIKTAVFYSNWELSAARAGSVVRVLSDHGVSPGRLAVVGYGEQRPMQTNDTAEGRNANRRVVVVILSTDLMRQSDQGKDPGSLPATNQAPGQAPAQDQAPAPAQTTQTPGGDQTPAPGSSQAPAETQANAQNAGAQTSGAAAAASAQNTTGVTLSPMTIKGNSADQADASASDSDAVASPADSPQATPAPTANIPATNTTLARNLHPQ
jgi:chemotaxis protein MotB